MNIKIKKEATALENEILVYKLYDLTL